MVRFEDVAFRYDAGPEILRGLSLHLESGSFHDLFGPSGAGKSSLLRLIYLAQRASSGRVSLFGRDVAGLTRSERALMRRKIGVVFQDFRLLNHLTTVENVALPLRIAGQRGAQIRRDAEELLAWVGLEEHFAALPPTLSGGQQQRIAIARAVISRPSLLLADEPTGNVDDRIGLRLLRLFGELHKMGTTVLIATHSEPMITRFSHPLLQLADGAVTLSPAGELPAGVSSAGNGAFEGSVA